MRNRRAGKVLLGLGLTVGIAASVAWVLGFEPSQLPANLLDIALYKLTGIAALGLLGAGAVVIRGSKQQHPEKQPVDSGTTPKSELGAGHNLGGVNRAARQAEHTSQERQDGDSNGH